MVQQTQKHPKCDVVIAHVGHPLKVETLLQQPSEKRLLKEIACP